MTDAISAGEAWRPSGLGSPWSPFVRTGSAAISSSSDSVQANADGTPTRCAAAHGDAQGEFSPGVGDEGDGVLLDHFAGAFFVLVEQGLNVGVTLKGGHARRVRAEQDRGGIFAASQRILEGVEEADGSEIVHRRHGGEGVEFAETGA